MFVFEQTDDIVNTETYLSRTVDPEPAAKSTPQGTFITKKHSLVKHKTVHYFK